MAEPKGKSKPADGWYVLSNLHHDGTLYEPGQRVELDAAAGEALRAIGVVSRIAPEPDAEPGEAAA